MLRYTSTVLLPRTNLIVASLNSPTVRMPLTPSVVTREPMHTRTIKVQSYAREDGLWDLEAELIDYKGYDFPTRNGGVFKAGRHVHHMHLRITIDKTFEVLAAEAAYDAAPYGEQCTAIDVDYGDLVGMNLLKNFRNTVKERFGRTAGCTHMTELTNVLPTAAVQTMANQRRLDTGRDKRPFQLDGCHALDTAGAVALQYYPRWYTGDAPQSEIDAAQAALDADARARADAPPSDSPCKRAPEAHPAGQSPKLQIKADLSADAPCR